MAKPRLAPIYERLAGAPQYHPMNAETFADWSLEAGDIVTVKREGTGYSSPVHTVRMKWNGVPTTQIESVGEKKRESIAKMSAQKYARGGGGGAGVRNSHFQHIYVEDAYGRMRSGLYLTESSAQLYARDLYAQMESGLALTTSSAHLYVDDRYNQMSSGLALTTSSAHLYVDDRYRQMSSGLSLTSSSAALYVDDKYNQMKSGLDLTTSSAHLYVDDKYNQMSSGLKLTASSAALYVDDKYNQMSSGLKLTSSSAALYVDNKYNQMKAGLSVTMSSAVMYARSKDAAAEIVARINEDNEGEIKLDAQHVYIGNDKSTTVINGKLNASDVTANYIKGKIGDIAQVVMNGASVVGDLYIRNGSGQQQNASAAIWDIQLTQSGNTYTLKRKRIQDTDYVEIGTFSRATSLSGAWSGGVLTVSASPQGNTFKADLFTAGHWGYASSESKTTYYGSISAKHNGGSTSYSTGESFEVDASQIYTNGYNAGSSAGAASVTVSSVAVYGSPAATATSISVKATASNGATKIDSISITAQRNNAYNSGYSNGSPSSGTAGGRTAGVSVPVHDFTIKRADGTTKIIQIDVSNIYTTAREGYTYGTFTSLTARPVVSSGGTVYYQAGTAATYYKGNGSGGYLCGTGETCYKAGTERTFNLRASSSIKLKKYGTGSVTLYVAPTTSATGITHEWYYIDSGGTSYYQAGGTVTVTSQGEKQTLYPRGSYVYGRGDTVSVTPITGTAIRIGAAGTYYSKS